MDKRRSTANDQPASHQALGCAFLIALVLLLGYCVTRDEEQQPLDEQGRAEVMSWREGFATIAAPCNAASGQVAAQAASLAEGGQALDAYTAATRMRDACWSASRTIRNTDLLESFSGKSRELAEEARQTCSLAMFARKTSAEAAMQVFDGDIRPSTLSAVREEAEAATGLSAECQSALAAALKSVGLPPPTKEMPAT